MPQIATQSTLPLGAKNGRSYAFIAIAVLLTFFLAEIINSFTIKAYINAKASPFSTHIRVMLEIVFLTSFCIHRKISKEAAIMLGTSAFLLITSYIGNDLFLLKSPDIAKNPWGMQVAEKGAISSNVAFFFANQCVFTFLCFTFFKRLFKRIPEKSQAIVFRAYEWVIYVYSMSAILGLLTGVEMLHTYPYIGRWGYNGLLPYSNASSGFWLIALFYSLLIFTEEKRTSPLYASLIAMMLAGAKSLWVLALAIMLVFVWKFFTHRSKYMIGILGLILSAALLFLLPHILPALRKEVDVVDSILRVFENRGDILEVMTSGRLNVSGSNGRIFGVLPILDSLTPFNWLFGGLGGIVIVEMAFIDIPFAFGAIGSAVLIYSYLVMFRNIKQSFRIYFYTFYFITAFLIGWLFNTPSLAPYLSIFIMRANLSKTFTSDQKSSGVVYDPAHSSISTV